MAFARLLSHDIGLLSDPLRCTHSLTHSAWCGGPTDCCLSATDQAINHARSQHTATPKALTGVAGLHVALGSDVEGDVSIEVEGKLHEHPFSLQ